MGPHELLHFVVEVVYLVQRVVFVLHSAGFGACVDLAFQGERVDDGVVALFAVVDQGRAFGDSLSVCLEHGLVARLAFSGDDVEAALPVGPAGHIVLAAPRETAFRIGFPFGGFLLGFRGVEELLVDPNPSGQDDPVLDSSEHGEDLGKPVSAGRFRVSVVRRRRLQRMEFEQVEQKLYPFADGYLFRIEDRARQSRELFATFAAFEASYPRFPEPVFCERPAAMRAAFRLNRIDERQLLRRRLSVLLLVPLQNGGLDHGLRPGPPLFPGPRKLSQRREKGLSLFLLHVFGGRLFHDGDAGPPSQICGAAVERPFDCPSFFFGRVNYNTLKNHPSFANEVLKRFLRGQRLGNGVSFHL